MPTMVTQRDHFAGLESVHQAFFNPYVRTGKNFELHIVAGEPLLQSGHQ
jgi:hypothetical protein